MPSWPSRVRISAKMKAISVSGFCRPVSTLASLTGVASGRKVSDSLTHSMRSPLSAAVRASAPTLAYETMFDSTAFMMAFRGLIDERRSLGLQAAGLDDVRPARDLAVDEARVVGRFGGDDDEAVGLELGPRGRIAEGLGHRGLEFVDDRLGRALGCRQARP